ncbi:MAG: ceramidase domain-containing protein, partial [Bdellovibrionales bacterium]
MSLDFYCERLTSDFWAEPINAWTNLSFLVAGFWGFFASRGKTWGYSHTLSCLALFVGIGSFLFHTFANSWTHLLDLIPIFLFTLIFVFFSFRHKLNFNLKQASLLTIVFVACMVLIEIFVPKAFLNGSALYLPPLLTLFFIGLKVDRNYLFIAVVFAVSLVARTSDQQLCQLLPMGTHFIWHLLNGLCLALMIR